MIVIETMKPGCSFARGLPIVRYVLCNKSEHTGDIDSSLVESEEVFAVVHYSDQQRQRGRPGVLGVHRLRHSSSAAESGSGL